MSLVYLIVTIVSGVLVAFSTIGFIFYLFDIAPDKIKVLVIALVIAAAWGLIGGIVFGYFPVPKP